MHLALITISVIQYVMSYSKFSDDLQYIVIDLMIISSNPDLQVVISVNDYEINLISKRLEE